MNTKTEYKILKAAIDNTLDMIEDMKKNHGNHFLLEFIFDYEKDTMRTRLIDVTSHEK